LYLSFDLIEDAPIAVATSAGLLPLFGGGVPPARVTTMAEGLRRWARTARYLVPSTAPDDPHFEPRRYWRGPVWAVVNWMLAEGLAEENEQALAATLRADTAELIRTSGFSEYFDPLTGEGIGGGTFSWTAAVFLLLRSGSACPP
jgi:glycogen debranching enzyme